jgi:predicted flap endonuclease-1-like 5' DNA nuclease
MSWRTASEIIGFLAITGVLCIAIGWLLRGLMDGSRRGASTEDYLADVSARDRRTATLQQELVAARAEADEALAALHGERDQKDNHELVLAVRERELRTLRDANAQLVADIEHQMATIESLHAQLDDVESLHVAQIDALLAETAAELERRQGATPPEESSSEPLRVVEAAEPGEEPTIELAVVADAGEPSPAADDHEPDGSPVTAPEVDAALADAKRTIDLQARRIRTLRDQLDEAVLRAAGAMGAEAGDGGDGGEEALHLAAALDQPVAAPADEADNSSDDSSDNEAEERADAELAAAQLSAAEERENELSQQLVGMSDELAEATKQGALVQLELEVAQERNRQLSEEAAAAAAAPPVPANHAELATLKEELAVALADLQLARDSEKEAKAAEWDAKVAQQSAADELAEYVAVAAAVAAEPVEEPAELVALREELAQATSSRSAAELAAQTAEAELEAAEQAQSVAGEHAAAATTRAEDAEAQVEALRAELEAARAEATAALEAASGASHPAAEEPDETGEAGEQDHIDLRDGSDLNDELRRSNQEIEELRFRIKQLERVDLASRRLTDKAEVDEAPLEAGSRPAATGAAAAAVRLIANRVPDGGPVQDDLKKVKGIGPKYREQLAESGITSYAQLASLSDGDLEMIAEVIGRDVQKLRDDDWVGQARALHLETYGVEAETALSEASVDETTP